jgi:hypothetical protein
MVQISKAFGDNEVGLAYNTPGRSVGYILGASPSLPPSQVKSATLVLDGFEDD